MHVSVGPHSKRLLSNVILISIENANVWVKNPKLYINAISHGGRGVDSNPPMKNTLRIVFIQFVFNPAKLMYNCRSHTKRDRQKFKIEGIEEL